MCARPPGLFRMVPVLARAELRELATQPGLYLFVPLIVLFTLIAALDAKGMLDTPLLLTAGTLAVSQLDTLPLFTCILLLVYTVEALERERSVGFAVLRDALPVRTVSLLLGKFLALNGDRIRGAGRVSCRGSAGTGRSGPRSCHPWTVSAGLGA